MKIKKSSVARRKRRRPSERDWKIWQSINHDLVDWLYTGLTGRFQIAGHRQIDRWAAHYTNKIVLEVGCGHGHHLYYGHNHYARYIGLDIEHKFLGTLKNRFLDTRTVNGDVYQLPFQTNSIDCVLSVYNFEHLRQLPEALSEIWRVLKSDGELLIGLPTEGGMLYEVGRQLTSKRYMERKYGIDYDAVVHWEHWNTCSEVIEMISQKFFIRHLLYLPFLVPSVHINVIAVLKALPRNLNEVYGE